jgi:hypothetical protein
MRSWDVHDMFNIVINNILYGVSIDDYARLMYMIFIILWSQYWWLRAADMHTMFVILWSQYWWLRAAKILWCQYWWLRAAKIVWCHYSWLRAAKTRTHDICYISIDNCVLYVEISQNGFDNSIVFIVCILKIVQNRLDIFVINIWCFMRDYSKSDKSFDDSYLLHFEDFACYGSRRFLLAKRPT